MKKFKIISVCEIVFKIVCVSVWAALLFVSTASHADSIFQGYNSGHFDFDASLDYFKTTSNFLPDGSKLKLPSGNQFQSINSLIGARYVFFDDLGLFGKMGVGNAESKDSLSTRTNSTVSHVLIGADYRIFKFDAWTVTALLSYSQALEKISATTDSALNNDGANEVKAFLESSYKLGDFVPYAKAGINYRSEGLSTLFLYTLAAEIRSTSLAGGAAINGLMSIKDDEKTNTPGDREAITNRVNGGSKRYDSINPNLTDLEIYLKYKMYNDLVFKLTTSYTLAGSNSAEGLQFGLAATWSFGQHVKKSSAKKLETLKPVTLDPTDKNFKEDTNDGVNQDYFKPVTPSKSDYIEQIDGSSENLRNATEPDVEAAPLKTKIKPKAALNPALEKDYKIKIKKKKKKVPR